MADAELRALVIDDDETFASILSRGFRQRGFAVRCCHDAQSAVLCCQQWQPTHITLDLNLPDSSGMVILPTLLDTAPGARLVVLTGYPSIATAVEATRAQAMDYLCKPATVAEILQAFAGLEAAPAAVAEQPASVDRLEWEHIQRVLAAHDGNVSATARALGMHRRTLQRKLQKRPARQ